MHRKPVVPGDPVFFDVYHILIIEQQVGSFVMVTGGSHVLFGEILTET